MQEFKVYLHAILILAVAGIGLTLLWTLWPVLLVLLIVFGVAALAQLFLR